MSVQSWIYLGAAHSLGFAVFHMFFWKLFRWHGELAGLGVANRAIVQILNVMLIYIFLFMTAAGILMPASLATTGIGRFVLGAFSGFWVVRTVLQFIFLPYNVPVVHLLTALFVAGAVIHAMPLVLL